MHAARDHPLQYKSLLLYHDDNVSYPTSAIIIQHIVLLYIYVTGRSSIAPHHCRQSSDTVIGGGCVRCDKGRVYDGGGVGVLVI